MKRVFCFGSGVVDILMKSRDFRVMKSHQVQGGVAICEVYGGKMGVDEMELSTGGAGTNVAVGVSRLNMVTATVVRVGDDLFGRKIKEELQMEKVEISQVQTDEKGKTGTSVVLVASDGGRSILTYRGVSKKIDSAAIDWEKVERAEWIHLSAMGGNAAISEDVINFAYSKKIPLSWNPGKTELMEKERMMKLLKKVEVLIVNRMEAAQLLGHDFEDQEKIARSLLKIGVVKAAVTDGRRGVMWVERVMGESDWVGRMIKMKAFKVESIDDTGAGDGFSSGLIAGLVRGEEAESAIKMGLANGASVVMALGAKAGLLREEEMEKWMRRRVEVVEERV